MQSRKKFIDIESNLWFPKERGNGRGINQRYEINKLHIKQRSIKDILYGTGKSHLISFNTGFPVSSAGKESTCSSGDQGAIPGLGRSPGGGRGNPTQYACLEDSMDRGAWWATVHGVTKRLTELSDLSTECTSFNTSEMEYNLQKC